MIGTGMICCFLLVERRKMIMKKVLSLLLVSLIIFGLCTFFTRKKSEEQSILFLKFDSDCTTEFEQFTEDYEFRNDEGLIIKNQGKVIDEETVLRSDVLSIDSAGSTATIELHFKDRERYDELRQEYDKLPEIYDLKLEINRDANHLQSPYEVSYYPIYQKIKINDDGEEYDFEIPIGVEQVIPDLEDSF